jgi:hypothetical protein
LRQFNAEAKPKMRCANMCFCKGNSLWREWLIYGRGKVWMLQIKIMVETMIRWLSWAEVESAFRSTLEPVDGSGLLPLKYCHLLLPVLVTQICMFFQFLYSRVWIRVYMKTARVTPQGGGSNLASNFLDLYLICPFFFKSMWAC